MAVYNSRDVQIFINNERIDDKGFVEDADHVVVEPPKELYDAIQDKTGKVVIGNKMNKVIGQCKMSVLQGTEAERILRNLLNRQKNETQFTMIIKIDAPFKGEKWEISEAGIIDTPDSPFGSKIAATEYVFKGKVEHIECEYTSSVGILQETVQTLGNGINQEISNGVDFVNQNLKSNIVSGARSLGSAFLRAFLGSNR